MKAQTSISPVKLLEIGEGILMKITEIAKPSRAKDMLTS